jgi:hypothetical protein
MKNSGPLEDRILIRELYGLYADASSRGSAEDWLALWTDGGQWNSHIFQCTGKIELRQQWDSLWANFASLGFLSEVGPIEVTGDTAKARSVAREIIRLTDGSLYKLIGAYEDHLVKANGEWLYARRDYRPLVEEVAGQ